MAIYEACSCETQPDLGGYDYDFISSPPETLTCPICLLPFRDPNLLSCCGAKCCAVCIQRVDKAGQSCPLCKQPFTYMLDKWFQRKVLDLEVRCSRSKKGCEWIGELRHYSKHDREECEWGIVQCECGGSFARHQLASHKREECPMLPSNVMVKSLINKMEEKFSSEMRRHKEEMNTLMEQMKHEEQTYRKECLMKERILNEKIEQLEIKLVEQVQITNKLKEDAKNMRKHLSVHFPPCVLTMTGYSQRKKDCSRWYSTPIYSGPCGYKMCLCVMASGAGDAMGSHMSVYIYMMRGAHDDSLKWPFQGSIKLEMLNQKSDEAHMVMTVPFDVRAATGGHACRVTTEELAKKGWGRNKFITHTAVEKDTHITQYIKEDTLKFKVTKIVVHSL